MEGAQPTETVAYLLKREGVLEQFFAKRPKAKANYKFLDKRTAAMSQGSAMDEKPAKTEEAPVEAPAEVAAEGSEA
jgi:small subunit ribosomal protein S16